MARSSNSRKAARRDALGDYNSDAADIARYGVSGMRGTAAPGQEDAVPVAAPGQDSAGSPVAGRLRRRGRGPDDEVDPASSAWKGSANAISIGETDVLADKDRRSTLLKCGASAIILLVLFCVGMCISGANPGYGVHYQVYSPAEVLAAIGENLYMMFAQIDLVPMHDASMYYQDWPLYYNVRTRAITLLITIACAALLGLSGMLYQNVFKNPIAGPGILGVSSGVNLANAIMVLLFGASAATMIVPRYALSYGLGAAIIVLVMLAGFKMTGKGKPLDVVNMMLVGSVLSQMVGFVVTFITTVLVDEDVYDDYVSLSEMLTVDTSAFSIACLTTICVITVVPVYMMRFKLNALSFDEQEVRTLGVDLTPLRTVALIAGGLMMLAAQVHIGAVSLVAIIVPFLSRSLFGCEFRKQLLGNVFIGSILLMACRCVVDLIPFVGDGLGVGTAVSLFALPLFLLIVAFHMRGWE